MRGSILTILFILIITTALQVYAQGNVSIDINATRTVDALDTEISASTTLTPFEYVATIQVLQATQTAFATVQTVIPGIIPAQSAGEATAIENLALEGTSQTELAEITLADNDSALLSAFLSLCLVVIVLVFVALVYMMLASRNTGNQKS